MLCTPLSFGARSQDLCSLSQGGLPWRLSPSLSILGPAQPRTAGPSELPCLGISPLLGPGKLEASIKDAWQFPVPPFLPWGSSDNVKLRLSGRDRRQAWQAPTLASSPCCVVLGDLLGVSAPHQLPQPWSFGPGDFKAQDSVCPHTDSDYVDQAGLEITEIHTLPASAGVTGADHHTLALNSRELKDSGTFPP